MKAKLFILVVLVALATYVNGQIITVKSSFDADSIMLGEQINFSISVESDSKVKIGLPVYSDTLTSALEILSSSGIDTSYSENKRILSQVYQVTSFEPGWNTVPPQKITFRAGELTDTVYTTALLLTVLAPAVDTSLAIMPIKGPVNTPLSLAELLPWVLGTYLIVLLLTMLAALVWIYFRKEKSLELFIEKPLEPAHLIAFRALDQLKQDDLPSKGLIKEYYSALTEIIRVYITRQFAIHAMESTTAEILEAFSNQHLHEPKLESMLENLLMLADLVKFAKEDPSTKENEMHFKHAFEFVENTYRLFYSEEEANDPVQDSSLNVEPVELRENNG